MTSLRKTLSSLQIVLALVAVIVVLSTPFAWFRFYGYGAFALENTNTELLKGIIVLTTLGIAYAAYMWGWRSSGESAATFAKLTLYLGLIQWLWLLLGVLAVQNMITYNATFAFEGYYTGVDAASYAVVLGAIIFTVMGLVAVLMTRHPSPSVPLTSPRFCRKCGAALYTGDAFCRSCGAPVLA